MTTKQYVIPDWATNANFAAGSDPWSSQPTKTIPSAAKLATGRIPGERPPATETNWWRAAIAREVRRQTFLRQLNFLDDVDVSSVSSGGSISSACYTERDKKHTFFDTNGYVRETRLASGYSSYGLVIDDYGGGAAAGPGSNISAADSDRDWDRYCVAPGVADGIYYSAAGGAWTQATVTGTPGLAFTNIKCNRRSFSAGSNPLVIAVSNATPANVYISTGGVIFNSVTVTGFTTAAIGLHFMEDDTTYGKWILFSSTQKAVSTDGGNTWSTSSHSLGTMYRYGIHFDYTSQRLIVAPTGTASLYYSDNYGSSFTKRAFTFSEVSYPDTGDKWLDGDGVGEVIAMSNNGGTLTRVWACADIGNFENEDPGFEEFGLPNYASSTYYKSVVYGNGMYMIAQNASILRSLRTFGEAIG